MACEPAKQIPLELEYMKNTGISPQDVARLREWLSSQPHLPEQHITDLDLILTLYCCGRSMEISKQVLDLNLTLRSIWTAVFKDRVFDEKIVKALTTFLMKPLSTRSDDDFACFYGRLLDVNPKNFVFVDIIRTALMILDLCQYEEGTWPGIMVFVDLEGITLGHLPTLDLHTLQHSFYYVQEAFLLNLKSVHFLNAPPFMNKLMMLFKPFLKKELLEMIHIHPMGSQTFEKFYPLNALPETKSFARYRDEIIEKVKTNSEFFEKENKKRVLESLRPGKPKTASDIFGGVVGSFKRLDID